MAAGPDPQLALRRLPTAPPEPDVADRRCRKNERQAEGTGRGEPGESGTARCEQCDDGRHDERRTAGGERNAARRGGALEQSGPDHAATFALMK